MGYFESMVTPGGRYSVSKLSVEEVQRWIDKLKQTAFIGGTVSQIASLEDSADSLDAKQ